MTDTTVCITGLGLFTSAGHDIDTVADALRTSNRALRNPEIVATAHSDLPMGEVALTNDELSEIAGCNESNCRNHLLGLAAVRKAISDAGLTPELMRKRRVALISGTTVGGMDLTEKSFERMRQTRTGENCMTGHNSSMLNTFIADALEGVVDYSTVISTACSSGANAIALGARMLANDEADIVVAGGAESLTMFHINGFNSLMILDKQPCRPFDASRAGLNLGEGAAYVVMERTSDASRRDASPRSWVTGIGVACDAYHQTATSPDGRGAAAAMSQALHCAGLKPCEIQYVNAHGTGTPDNDASERRAMMTVFGDDLPPFSSTKGITGHTTSAAGAIEAVIAIMCIERQMLPASVGFKEADADLPSPVTETRKVEIHNVMSNSFGFGGNETSLIFSDAPRPLSLWIEDKSITTKVIAESVVDSDEQLHEVKRFVKPMELRRMGRLMKGVMLSAMTAIEKAGIETPDAIIVATDWGCWENTEKFLNQIIDNGEQMLNPSLFMQSTHNTPAGLIAIATGCHGFNVTYSDIPEKAHAEALAEADRLIRSGIARNVLVGLYEESTPLLNDLLAHPDRPLIDCRTLIIAPSTK